MTVTAILALIAGLLAILSLIPQAREYPLLSVAVLLLAIALYVGGTLGMLGR